MALEILSYYPREFYWKGFVYNMLGGLYGKQNLYVQAKDMYVKACYNDSLARHNYHLISSLSNLGGGFHRLWEHRLRFYLSATRIATFSLHR